MPSLIPGTPAAAPRIPAAHPRRLATPRPRILVALAAIALSGVWLWTSGQAQEQPGDWRQWGGPQRNFTLPETRIARTWPAGGPREMWRRPLGDGYSAILSDGSRLVTQYRRGNAEVVVGLDAASGRTVWEHAYDAPLTRDGYFDIWNNAAGPGPYATPAIADGVAFAVGVTGKFHALDVKSGAVKWSSDLVQAFTLKEYNAFTASPLVYGDKVILPLGSSSRGVVAFRRDNGTVAWQSPELALGPGSPILIDVDGQRELVIWGRGEIIGIDPDSGAMRWRHGHPTQMGLNISTPLWEPGRPLFISSAYGGGSRMIRLTRDGGRTRLEDLWSNSRMRLHFGASIRVGNLIIGSSGDFGPAFLVALNAETGTEVWRERSFARAQMINAGGTLILVDEDGEVAIASASERGLEVHARKRLLTSNAWTPPTLVGDVLYLRDRKEVAALKLGN